MQLCMDRLKTTTTIEICPRIHVLTALEVATNRRYGKGYKNTYTTTILLLVTRYSRRTTGCSIW